MQHQMAEWDLGYRTPMEYFLPYDFGFGVDVENPERYDLTEPHKFLSLLRELDVKLVNLTAGSPLALHTFNGQLYIHPLMVTSRLKIPCSELRGRWKRLEFLKKNSRT